MMKLKIVNKIKFKRAIAILLAVSSVLILGGYFNYASSKTEIVYKTKFITKGETLWSIAEKELEENSYYKNQDLRKVIYDIQHINNLKNKNIYEGGEILIPTYK